MWTFIDLGLSPIANNLVTFDQLGFEEPRFPLHVRTCEACGLVQLPEVSSRVLLFPTDYSYHSSYSSSWLLHCENYVNKMVFKLGLTELDFVIEVASNDGYLLQYFQGSDIRVLGIEPAAEVAKVAVHERGIPTLVDFFGMSLAESLLLTYQKPMLMIANNVLAHVPDIHDFISGFNIMLADEGVITFEFPHLLNLILLNQFDTIYHEHYSYLSLTALNPVFESHGLRIFNVEELPTHGGSLRVYLCKEEASWVKDPSVQKCLDSESPLDPRLENVAKSVQERTQKVKLDLLDELSRAKDAGLRVAAYGAAAKGNTLLNFVGIGADVIEYVIDINPHKQGKYLPGSRIPVLSEEHLRNNPPDILLILPWNLADEIVRQLGYLREQGIKFLRAIPSLQYF
jgi:hypothetical protein